MSALDDFNARTHDCSFLNVHNLVQPQYLTAEILLR